MATTPWFKDPVTQPYNPPVEPGIDIGTPFHTTITSLLPGTVAGISYGGYGARVDVATPQGDVYYQHLDSVEVKKGQNVSAGQALGLSGGQLYGGNLPNSPLNSTGPHVEVGYGRGGNPAQLLAQGGVGIGQGGVPVAPTPAQDHSGSSSGGGLVNINIPDPIATLQAWVTGLSGGAVAVVKDNIIPLAVAAVIILIVLGTGQGQQSSPQIVPVPV